MSKQPLAARFTFRFPVLVPNYAYLSPAPNGGFAAADRSPFLSTDDAGPRRLSGSPAPTNRGPEALVPSKPMTKWR